MNRKSKWNILLVCLILVFPPFTLAEPPSLYDYKWSYYSGVAQYEKDGKLGLINEANEVILPAEYDEIGLPGPEGYFSVTQEGKKGMARIDGSIVTPCVWHPYCTMRFVEERCVVYNDQSYGFFDEKGSLYTDPDWTRVRKFSEGLAAFRNSSGLWGFLDKEGNVAIEPQWDDVGDFSEGMAPFTHANDLGYGYINQRGEVVLPVNASWGIPWGLDAFEFENGFSPVCVYQGEGMGKTGIIDQSGNYVVAPRWKTDIPAIIDGTLNVLDDLQWGYVNTQGDVIIAPQFEHQARFREGRLVIRKYEGPEAENYSHPDAFMMVDVFHEDVVTYCFDNEGNIVFSRDDLAHAGAYCEGLSPVIFYDGRTGFMDTSGNLVVGPHEDRRYSPFVQGYAVFFSQIENASGVIDRSGNVLIDPMQGYTFSTSYPSYPLRSPHALPPGVFFAKKDGQKGYIDVQGNILSGIKE